MSLGKSFIEWMKVNVHVKFSTIKLAIFVYSTAVQIFCKEWTNTSNRKTKKQIPHPKERTKKAILKSAKERAFK